MGGRAQRFFQSLSFHLLLPLVVTVVVVLAAHAVVGIRSAREHFVSFVQTDIERYSRLIQRATHDGMLLNRKEEVQAIIERLAAGPEIATIRIYDKSGTIALSAQRGEIGKKFNLDTDTCRSCHTGAPVPRDVAVFERAGLARVEGGPEVLRYLSVIANERSCSTAACHAHPADEKILGVLDFEMSLAPLEATMLSARRQSIWTTLILSAIIGLVVAVFFRYGVQRPVAEIYHGTRRIAEGNLDARIEVRGRHELARLATAFNHMAEDLTAARAEVTRWSQQLEEKVAQKTAALQEAQRQVLHMEKMASLGKLSATVAHELNNPMTGMLVYAELVKRELGELPLPDDIRGELVRYLSMIEQECVRCAAIVKNLLVFARRAPPTMSPIDVNEVVQRSLMLIRHRLEPARVQLETCLLTGDARMEADASQLEQALVALLVNALEAIQRPQGEGGLLRVSLRGDADWIHIEVSDSGGGIPAEVLPQIFEPFFSTKENGLGLGLAVVYGIVQSHGGRIDVDSQVGRGTRFTLVLPRKPAAADRISLSGKASSPSSAHQGVRPS